MPLVWILWPDLPLVIELLSRSQIIILYENCRSAQANSCRFHETICAISHYSPILRENDDTDTANSVIFVCASVLSIHSRAKIASQIYSNESGVIADGGSWFSVDAKKRKFLRSFEIVHIRLQSCAMKFSEKARANTNLNMFAWID